jgi:ATP-dependent Lhr-like helicase
MRVASFTLDLPAARARTAAKPEAWRALEQVREWLKSSNGVSLLPKPGDLLVETFRAPPIIWSATRSGRLAHQPLGMLLTRRLERARPGHSASSQRYALAVWGLGDVACASRAAISRSPNCSTRTLGDDLKPARRSAHEARRSCAHRRTD